MRMVKSVPVEDMALRGSIKDSDVARLMKAFGEDPHISDGEAESLLWLNRSCAIQGPQWATFFADAIAEFLINQTAPEGYITVEKAAWLVGRIAVDGWIASRSEFDLLRAILARARWYPLSLGLLALRQVRAAIVHGSGPLRPRQSGRPGVMLPEDVAIIRDILLSFGAESRLPLTRAEAEALIEINAAVKSGVAPAAWSDLFIKAIANLMLGAGGYAVPERSLALAEESFLPTSGAFGDLVEVCLASTRLEYTWPSSPEAALAKLERQRIEIVTNEEFYSDEEDLTYFLNAVGGSEGQEAEVVNYLCREGLIDLGADAYPHADVA